MCVAVLTYTEIRFAIVCLTWWAPIGVVYKVAIICELEWDATALTHAELHVTPACTGRRVDRATGIGGLSNEL